MATNILALPQSLASIETGNNESWVDSLVYFIGGSEGDSPGPSQLDLRGIEFEMEIRRRAEDHEVVLRLSTDDETLSVGALPNYGFLLINVPYEIMKAQRAGDYVADMRAMADGFTRVIVRASITIVEGVSKSP
jgi:hypothetical protein